jgi:hypothetical protein
VLLPFLVVVALTAVGVLVVVKVAHVAMRRLGLELEGVLIWLGLAETPVDEFSVRRARLAPAQPNLGKSAAGGGAL